MSVSHVMPGDRVYWETGNNDLPGIVIRVSDFSREALVRLDSEYGGSQRWIAYSDLIATKEKAS